MQNEKKWYIIVNPAAGNGEAQRAWPRIKAILTEKFPGSSIVYTEYRDHAITLVAEAVKNGFRHIMAIGGDGTNHEVCNGIMMQKTILPTEITYVLLPVGTGNDWIRTHGISKDLEKWVTMVEKGKTFLQDVGTLEYVNEGKKQHRFFFNVAGLAYDAFVVRYIEKNKRNVKIGLLYLFMIVRCIFMYQLRKARIRFNGQENSGYHYTINAGICKYSGAGMSLVPHAIPDDGQLALTIAGKVSKLEVLLNSYRFYNDSITRHRKIDGYQTKEIKVDAMDDGPILLEADGEFLGETPVRISIMEKSLKIIIP